jgi:hypothetical protein
MRKPDEEDVLISEAMAKPVETVARFLWGAPRFQSSGARWMWRHQPKNVGELAGRLPGHPDMVRDRAIQVMHDKGELVDTRTNDDGSYRVRGIVHFGFQDWVYALATVTVRPSSDGYNDVLVRTVRKGSFTKSRSEETATRLVAEALPQSIPEYGRWA